MTGATPTHSHPQMSAQEMVESLTGFDEIAIEKHFGGFDIYTDAETHGVRALRALAFVTYRRAGLADKDALEAAQGAPFKEISAMFPDDEPEVDEDDPETPAGKDAAQPG